MEIYRLICWYMSMYFSEVMLQIKLNQGYVAKDRSVVKRQWVPCTTFPYYDIKCHNICPGYKTSNWEKNSIYFKCTSDTPYHCAIDDLTGAPVNACIAAKTCNQGEQPQIFFPRGIADVTCKPCKNVDEAFNSKQRNSDTFSLCFERRRTCRAVHGEIECEKPTEEQKYYTQTKCTCIWQEQYIPEFTDKDYCSAEVRCMYYPCDDTADGKKQERLNDFTCGPVCEEGYVRTDNLAECMPVEREDNETTATTPTTAVQKEETKPTLPTSKPTQQSSTVKQFGDKYIQKEDNETTATTPTTAVQKEETKPTLPTSKPTQQSSTVKHPEEGTEKDSGNNRIWIYIVLGVIGASMVFAGIFLFVCIRHGRGNVSHTHEPVGNDRSSRLGEPLLNATGSPNQSEAVVDIHDRSGGDDRSSSTRMAVAQSEPLLGASERTSQSERASNEINQRPGSTIPQSNVNIPNQTSSITDNPDSKKKRRERADKIKKHSLREMDIARKALVQNKSSLMDMDSRKVIDKLQEKEVFQRSDLRDLVELKLTSEKNEKIFNLMTMTGLYIGTKGKYRLFKECLDESHHGWLVDMLEKKEDEVIEDILRAEAERIARQILNDIINQVTEVSLDSQEDISV